MPSANGLRNASKTYLFFGVLIYDSCIMIKIIMNKSFYSRCKIFLDALKKNEFINSVELGKLCGCSRSTAYRVVERLQIEFGAPIKYSNEEKGYFLTDKSFQLDNIPAGKDELTALFLLKDTAESLDAKDLSKAIDTLWESVLKSNKKLSSDLQKLTNYFSSDFTAVGTIADLGVIDLLNFAAAGDYVELEYQSPWRHSAPKNYKGLIEHIHLSDATVYVLFADVSGRNLVFNASSIISCNKLNEQIPSTVNKTSDIKNWLSGFGIWADEEIEKVEIQISGPAANYYAKQRWHIEEQNKLENGLLTKTFDSIISPELVRRILSVGSHINDVKPSKLKELVIQESTKIVAKLNT
jgi:predicted DNA-binding transcriptional regulator YafY